MPYEIYKGLLLDGSLSGVPIVKKNGIAVGINSMFYTHGEKNVESKILRAAPILLPIYDHKNKAQFQAFISEASLNTLASTYLKLQDGRFNILDELLIDKLHNNLRTSDFRHILPGIVKKFGPNRQVEFRFNITRVGGIKVREMDNSISMNGDVHFLILVHGDNGKSHQVAADLILENILFRFTATI